MELSYPRRAQKEECFRIECNRSEFEAFLDAIEYASTSDINEKRISESDIDNMRNMLNKNPADEVPVSSQGAAPRFVR